MERPIVPQLVIPADGCEQILFEKIDGITLREFAKLATPNDLIGVIVVVIQQILTAIRERNVLILDRHGGNIVVDRDNYPIQVDLEVVFDFKTLSVVGSAPWLRNTPVFSAEIWEGSELRLIVLPIMCFLSEWQQSGVVAFEDARRFQKRTKKLIYSKGGDFPNYHPGAIFQEMMALLLDLKNRVNEANWMGKNMKDCL